MFRFVTRPPTAPLAWLTALLALIGIPGCLAVDLDDPINILILMFLIIVGLHVVYALIHGHAAGAGLGDGDAGGDADG
jgi:hypothetical protein